MKSKDEAVKDIVDMAATKQFGFDSQYQVNRIIMCEEVIRNQLYSDIVRMQSMIKQQLLRTHPSC